MIHAIFRSLAQAALSNFIWGFTVSQEASQIASLCLLSILLSPIVRAEPTGGSLSIQKAFGIGPVEVLVQRSLSGLSEFTLEAWVLPRDTKQAQKIISNSELGGFNIGLSEKQSRAGWFQFAVYLETGATYREVFGGPANAERWQHVAGTYDGHHIRIFVDGTLQAMELCEGGLLQPSPAALVVGGEASARNGAGEQQWRGLIAGVRISRCVRYHDDFPSPVIPAVMDKETLLLVLPVDQGWGFDCRFAPELEWARASVLQPPHRVGTD